VRLVPYAPEHVASIQAWMHDPEVQANTPVPEPVPDDHAAGWLTRFVDGGAWAILDGSEVVGFACAPRLDLVRGDAELGYQVAPTRRGRGVARFALTELTQWAFEAGVFRIELHINHDNVASQRVAARCGYLCEGLLRQTYLKPGRRVDTQIWSRLVSDPQPMES
jgi:RimJ/RimL family protein N-acetyltransferase